jgi:hypothetical protein
MQLQRRSAVWCTDERHLHHQNLNHFPIPTIQSQTLGRRLSVRHRARTALLPSVAVAPRCRRCLSPYHLAQARICRSHSNERLYTVSMTFERH